MFDVGRAYERYRDLAWPELSFETVEGVPSPEVVILPPARAKWSNSMESCSDIIRRSSYGVIKFSRSHAIVMHYGLSIYGKTLLLNSKTRQLQKVI